MLEDEMNWIPAFDMLLSFEKSFDYTHGDALVVMTITSQMQGVAATESLVYKLSKFVFKTEPKVINCY